MQNYEIVYIAKDEADPGLKKMITDKGGKITQEKCLDRKKFAYAIKKEVGGIYTIVYFDIESDKLASLESKIKLNEKILRYLIIKSEKIISKPDKPVEKELKIEKIKIERREVVPEKKPAAKIKEKVLPKVEKEKIITPVRPTIEIAGKEKEISEEERLQRLEEKLDELLKE